jgi:hypothetical protein
LVPAILFKWFNLNLSNVNKDNTKLYPTTWKANLNSKDLISGDDIDKEGNKI